MEIAKRKKQNEKKKDCKEDREMETNVRNWKRKCIFTADNKIGRPSDSGKRFAPMKQF
jgi:hypothetical protein